MRPVNQTVSTVTSGPWIPLDITQNPFSCSVGCRVLTGSTYQVDYTYDDPFDTVTVPVAFGQLTNMPAGSTANKDQFLTAPIRAVRLTVTVAAGNGVKMTVIQGLGL
jgi:hypothetical protein